MVDREDLVNAITKLGTKIQQEEHKRGIFHTDDDKLMEMAKIRYGKNWFGFYIQEVNRNAKRKLQENTEK